MMLGPCGTCAGGWRKIPMLSMLILICWGGEMLCVIQVWFVNSSSMNQVFGFFENWYHENSGLIFDSCQYLCVISLSLDVQRCPVRQTLSCLLETLDGSHSFHLDFIHDFIHLWRFIVDIPPWFSFRIVLWVASRNEHLCLNICANQTMWQVDRYRNCMDRRSGWLSEQWRRTDN